MGLRRLHHFVTLIEQGSFARAADALHLSQPALSRSIQALEADYGCALVDRSYGKAGTTAAGTMVLARARRMLREGRELRRELQLLQDIEIGSLRLGFGPFAAAFLLEPVLAALVTRHPRLGIDLEIADTQSMVQALEAERLDVFIGESQSLAGQPHLHIDRLPALQTGFFVRAGHPLAGRRAVALTELAGFPVAGPRLPARVQAFFAAQLQAEADARGGPAAAPEALLTVTCDDMHALRTLMQATDTVVLVPRSMMAGACAAGEAAALPLRPATELRAPYGAVWLAGRTLSPAARAFVALVHEVLPEA
ncbi:LysR family transcriptional regulator [Cupriavidus sp. USMAA2-4]|uniref:LysR family transcriptional regulator n=1 Tax=Cupriavidus malaysiensis TaxID=367825 RepID=A0ABN4TTL1_9BURK|nr:MULTISPECIES: LysR family transcriptional regulator [Cupriavidus]AOY92602.1 LysR family transcriptional regulator [Cupriavidus sp. USMAA2-4]AOZ00952.1 LysR family transcriptional regulator [Cupriavidus sp. USMAHM13]AOZ07684.1 LysR family transcriptional regulator [Cupriavidus malaysiensis]